MKIGIIGLPQSGKSTIFKALTGEFAAHEDSSGLWRQAVVKVPDERLPKLQEIFSSRKIVPAQVEYIDVAFDLREREGRRRELEQLLTALKPVDALLLVVRNFELAGLAPEPQRELKQLHEELLFSDLVIVERRLERLEKEIKKGKVPKERELELLKRAKVLLEEGKPLRADEELKAHPLLKGYTFLSIKPLLVVVNSGEDNTCPELSLPLATEVIEVKGRLEVDLLELSPEEAEIFRQEWGVSEAALPRLIRKSFEVLDLICFLTGGEKEARAWPIPRGTTAQKAAGTIHSDIERGFIRAEVINFNELVALGSYQKAQKAGKVRLEGKDYIVQDGDVIIFRFKV